MSCRGFPEARPAYWEAPETLRPPHIVNWTCAQKVGVYFGHVDLTPGETQDARKVGVSPGEMISARKTVIPRARLILILILLDDYCIRPVLGPIRRRHFLCMKV